MLSAAVVIAALRVHKHLLPVDLRDDFRYGCVELMGVPWVFGPFNSISLFSVLESFKDS